MRLSKENDKGEESASIETQRKILRDFAENNQFRIYREYVDDGWSGTNLERPAFRQLQCDIEAGKVNVVLTKDLSRLGRNSGRIGMLIDEYFPKHRVRYISVSEGIDTFRRTITNSIVTPVQNFANELYAADISNKIHAAFAIKMKKGEYIGSFPPYGYRKDPNNRNHLLLDSVSSEFVRQIFAYAEEGYSPTQIAKLLNEKQIPTPLHYRCCVNSHFDVEQLCTEAKWNGTSVGKILRNEVYLGHTLQGKTEKPSFKSKYICSKPKTEWIKVEHTHEAIVDEETWAIVRKRLGSRSKKRNKGFVNLFSGIAKCADCGKNMSTAVTNKKGATANLTCGGYKLGGTAKCSNHFIDYDDLYRAVQCSLKKYVRFTDDEIKRIAEDTVSTQDDFAEQAESMEKKLQAIHDTVERLFRHPSFHLLNTEQLNGLLEKLQREQTACEQKLTELKKQSESAHSTADAEAERRKCVDFAERLCTLQTPDSELLHLLIDRIDVHQGVYVNGRKEQKIDIYFKFQCEPEVMEF